MPTTYVDQVQETLPAANTLIYTAVGTNLTSSHIIYATAHNATSSSANIKVNIVQSGDSVAATNRYIDANIAPNSTLDLTSLIGAILKSNDAIYAIAGTASALNLKIGIKEIKT